MFKKIWMPVFQELNLEPKRTGAGKWEKERISVGETGIQWDLQGMPIVCFLQ